MKTILLLGVLLVFFGNEEPKSKAQDKMRTTRNYLEEEGLKGNIKRIKQTNRYYMATTKDNHLEFIHDIYINENGNIDSLINEVYLVDMKKNTRGKSTGFTMNFYYDSKQILEKTKQVFVGSKTQVEGKVEGYTENNKGYEYYLIKSEREKEFQEVSLDEKKRIQTRKTTLYTGNRKYIYRETFRYTSNGWEVKKDEIFFSSDGKENIKTTTTNYKVEKRDEMGNPVTIIGTDKQGNVTERVDKVYEYQN